MWIPNHTRQSTIQHLALTCIILGSFALSGCTQFPQVLSRPHAARISVDASDETPAPDFDSVTSRTPEIAATPLSGIVSAPQPFQWKKLGTSSGQRGIEGITIGKGGYRTLILGSVAGDDPLAIALTERIAREIHRNSIILGGIEVTVIRNPNPDGEVSFRMENDNGVYLNRQFPISSDVTTQLSDRAPEIRFLLNVLAEGQPQRVIHIRTYGTENGLVAASSGAATVAREVADWLNGEFIALPGNSAQGTLERFLSETKSCDVITFAIPQTAKKSTLWETYGDALLNLLLDEDFETRSVARRNNARTSADRRGKK